MFVRRKSNRSGSTSVQVIQKIKGKYKVLKTVGCATTLQDIENLNWLQNRKLRDFPVFSVRAHEVKHSEVNNNIVFKIATACPARREIHE